MFLFVPCGGLSWLHVSFVLHFTYAVSYRIHYNIWSLCAVIRLQVIFPSHFDHVSYLHFVQFSNHPYLICALAMFATTERHYCRREQQFTTISQTVRSYQPLYRRIKLNIFTRSQLLSAGGYCFWSRHVVLQSVCPCARFNPSVSPSRKRIRFTSK